MCVMAKNDMLEVDKRLFRTNDANEWLAFH